MIIHATPIEFVQTTWPLVEKYIVSSLLDGGDINSQNMAYNVHHVLGYLTSGQWELFVAVEEGEVVGAGTVSYINYPLHRVAFITAVGGRLIATRDNFNQLSTLLKMRGVTMVQGYGRPSIIRLWKRFNFQPRSTLLETLI